MVQISHYLNSEGRSVFSLWFTRLTDEKAKVAIVRRLNRARAGNLGDHKNLGGGLYEMRVDVGQGHRIYVVRIGSELVVLLCGGSKQTQDRDIGRARAYLGDYFARGCWKGKVG